jgi:hypothetical protein
LWFVNISDIRPIGGTWHYSLGKHVQHGYRGRYFGPFILVKFEIQPVINSGIELRMNLKYLLIALFSSIVVSSCSKSNCESVECKPSPDSVKIIDVSPEQSVSLKVGDKVTIAYEVEYALRSSDVGQLALVVQGASNETLANEFYIASKGIHKETLVAEIVVPDTRAIHVFTPLSPQGQSSTTIVESRLYRVVK